MNRALQLLASRKNTRCQLLIRRLWAALETREGRRLSNQELSAHLNLSDSALSDWVAGKTELYQLEAILRLCERIDHGKSAELFCQHLRAYPTLCSPELGHDPAIVERLRTLLVQPMGLTFITGGNSSQRTFLITAMGHTYVIEQGVGSKLLGWDIHEPSWFVPLEGVLYRYDYYESPKLAVEGLPRTLIVSNGIWERFPQHRLDLIRYAARHQVIVALEHGSENLHQDIKSHKFPIHLVRTVGDAQGLVLTVTELQAVVKRKTLEVRA